ncbi:MAG: hypothetical protein R6U26_03910 [Candidatus Undinarchaeales archaeon]
MNNKEIIKAVKKTAKSFKSMIPVLVPMLFLIALINTAIPKSFYAKIFTGNFVLDPIIGAAFGSVAAGNPITSYILGGELLKNGISLTAVTAFIVCWVTVGIVSLPFEISTLGKKFAVSRNLVSFLSAIIVAILTALTLGVIA